MDKPTFLWLNGRLWNAQEASISPFDHGLLVGDGVFETLVAREGRPVGVKPHYERLVRSCQTIGLACITEAEFRQGIQAVLEANGLTDARVRVTLTSGDGPLGSDRGQGLGTVMAVATALKPWPPAEEVWIVPWVRNSRSALAGVKSLSYGENVRCLLHAKNLGSGEALLLNERDELCEGTGSNVFIVSEGRLMTPPLSSGCLAGTTRAWVLQACEVAGIECLQCDIPAAWLEGCAEAFLTSSTRDVHPISRLNGKPLTAPGPLTQRVQQAYAEFVERETA